MSLLFDSGIIEICRILAYMKITNGILWSWTSHPPNFPFPKEINLLRSGWNSLYSRDDVSALKMFDCGFLDTCLYSSQFELMSIRREHETFRFLVSEGLLHLTIIRLHRHNFHVHRHRILIYKCRTVLSRYCGTYVNSHHLRGCGNRVMDLGMFWDTWQEYISKD